MKSGTQNWSAAACHNRTWCSVISAGGGSHDASIAIFLSVCSLLERTTFGKELIKPHHIKFKLDVENFALKKCNLIWDPTIK